VGGVQFAAPALHPKAGKAALITFSFVDPGCVSFYPALLYNRREAPLWSSRFGCLHLVNLGACFKWWHTFFSPEEARIKAICSIYQGSRIELDGIFIRQQESKIDELKAKAGQQG